MSDLLMFFNDDKLDNPNKYYELQNLITSVAQQILKREWEAGKRGK